MEVLTYFKKKEISGFIPTSVYLHIMVLIKLLIIWDHYIPLLPKINNVLLEDTITFFKCCFS